MNPKIKWILIGLAGIIILTAVIQLQDVDKTTDTGTKTPKTVIGQQNESGSKQAISEILNHENPDLAEARSYMAEHDLKGRDITD